MSDTKEATTAPVTADDERELDPNAPWSPEEGIDEQGLSPEQIAEIRANLPVVQEILDWFEEQITGYLNPNVIAKVSRESKSEDVKEAVLFAQQLSRDYDKKRKDFYERFKPYLETKKPTE